MSYKKKEEKDGHLRFVYSTKDTLTAIHQELALCLKVLKLIHESVLLRVRIFVHLTEAFDNRQAAPATDSLKKIDNMIRRMIIGEGKL